MAFPFHSWESWAGCLGSMGNETGWQRAPDGAVALHLTAEKQERGEERERWQALPVPVPMTRKAPTRLYELKVLVVSWAKDQPLAHGPSGQA